MTPSDRIYACDKGDRKCHQLQRQPESESEHKLLRSNAIQDDPDSDCCPGYSGLDWSTPINSTSCELRTGESLDNATTRPLMNYESHEDGNKRWISFLNSTCGGDYAYNKESDCSRSHGGRTGMFDRGLGGSMNPELTNDKLGISSTPVDRVIIKVDSCRSNAEYSPVADSLQTKLDSELWPESEGGDNELKLGASTTTIGFYSNSMADVRELNRVGASGLVQCNPSGSLSDSSYKRPSLKDAEIERRHMEERLRNWKRTNKIITHIRENPFNMHLDCLERLSSLDPTLTNSGPNNEDYLSLDNRSSADFAIASENNGVVPQEPTSSGNVVQQTHNRPSDQQFLGINHEDNQGTSQYPHQQHLQSYATHLSHLYKRNQSVMDSHNDFRTLLYNIICCLLIQEDQVLATPSVTKMIDVIRTHLESAAKSYATAMIALGQSASNSQDGRRKSSTPSLSRASSSTGSGPTTSNNGSQESQQGVTTTTEATRNRNVLSPSDQLLSPDQRSQRPADFHRVSSVSYNDEQLINDLCNTQSGAYGNDTSNSSSGHSGVARCPDSPWRFEELCSECKHHNSNTTTNCNNSTHLTSQSSLETVSFLLDMNDSGVGTLFESQATDDTTPRMTNYRAVRKRLSDSVSEFRPKQQPSYISTDEYLSQQQQQLCYDTNRTSFYDDEETSALQKADSSDMKTVDTASRRAELEWTLNKLINFELKYTWLTSKDTLRRAIRKVGVPNEIRGKVWLILIDKMIGTKYDPAKLLEEASKTIDLMDTDEASIDEETQSILKQIELDVNRTMPGHKLFDDGAEGGVKLRRILVAYSIHVNRAIGEWTFLFSKP